jgi:hypothetical protein
MWFRKEGEKKNDLAKLGEEITRRVREPLEDKPVVSLECVCSSLNLFGCSEGLRGIIMSDDKDGADIMCYGFSL